MPDSRKRNHVRAAASIHFINGIDPNKMLHALATRALADLERWLAGAASIAAE
jgi:hypothetical protein